MVAATPAITTTDTAVANRTEKANVAQKTKKQQSNQPFKKNIMHRKSKFLVALAIAAITFGTLWLTLGPDQFNRGHRLCEHEHCCANTQVDNQKK